MGNFIFNFVLGFIISLVSIVFVMVIVYFTHLGVAYVAEYFYENYQVDGIFLYGIIRFSIVFGLIIAFSMSEDKSKEELDEDIINCLNEHSGF